MREVYRCIVLVRFSDSIIRDDGCGVDFHRPPTSNTRTTSSSLCIYSQHPTSISE